MAVHFEAQDEDIYKQVRARETQLENIDKLDNITETVDNMNIDGIEANTNDIKVMVENNLENQTNIDDLADTLNKITQGISDIKRSQTNINKKINDLQSTVDDLAGDNNE